jgi:hypothetical protein
MNIIMQQGDIIIRKNKEIKVLKEQISTLKADIKNEKKISNFYKYMTVIVSVGTIVLMKCSNELRWYQNRPFS